MVHQDISYYRDKTILITGGTGYLGFSLAQKLSSVACDIILLSRKNAIPEIPNSLANISLVTNDVKSSEMWIDLLQGVDIVFHFAAQTSSKYANENPRDDMASNLFPVVDIIEACQKYDYFPDIIFSATSTQVGLTLDPPIKEDRIDAPVTVYDINKLAAEKYLMYYSNQLGRRAVSLRLTNVYGPGPASSKNDRGILNMMVKRALHKEPLTVYGDGEFIRDYVYVDDVINAFLTAGAQINKLKGDYYLIGSGVGYTIKAMMKEIADQVEQKVGHKSAIEHVPMPNGISAIEFRNFVADTSKFRQQTAWRPEHPLQEGIKKTIEFFQKEI